MIILFFMVLYIIVFIAILIYILCKDDGKTMAQTIGDGVNLGVLKGFKEAAEEELFKLKDLKKTSENQIKKLYWEKLLDYSNNKLKIGKIE